MQLVGIWIARIFLIGMVAAGCNSRNAEKTAGEAGDKLLSQKDYSELHLDSNTINLFLASDTLYKGAAPLVKQFYKNRSYQFAWISEGKLGPAAPNFYNLLANYMHDFADSSVYDSKLNSLLMEAEEDEDDSPLHDRQRISELELRLTLAWFRYTQAEFTGRVENPKTLEWFIPRKKKNFEAMLNAHLETGKAFDLGEPKNPYYQRLKEKLKYFVSIERSGNWPVLDSSFIATKPGQEDSSLIAVKKMLLLSSDWNEADSSIAFTPTFQLALAHFQKRMGLPETGEPSTGTMKALQIPLRNRIRQMMVNLERLRWLTDTLAGNFLLVNIPEYKLHIFEGGKPSWESNVVVGKTAGRTQIFRGNLSQIILNPSWGVPPGIANKEVLPGLKKHRNYLAKHDMEAFSGNTRLNTRKINWHKYSKRMPFNIRQKAGKDNPLGRFKFFLSNSYWIYLHDSNEKYLFDANRRAFSHGCIRVEKAQELAQYLLRDNKAWPLERLEKMLRIKKDYGVPVEPAIPVFIVYLTSWVGNTGELNFRNDVYNLDENLAKTAFGE